MRKKKNICDTPATEGSNGKKAGLTGSTANVRLTMAIRFLRQAFTRSEPAAISALLI